MALIALALLLLLSSTSVKLISNYPCSCPIPAQQFILQLFTLGLLLWVVARVIVTFEKRKGDNNLWSVRLRHVKFTLISKICNSNKMNVSFLYGKNQAGCEKTKKLEFLQFTYWAFLSTYNFLAWLGITICVYKLEASHNMSLDSWYSSLVLSFEIMSKALTV